ncbi:MAG TPA: PD-(D/E)XK nuclease family protein [Nannocystis sp.]
MPRPAETTSAITRRPLSHSQIAVLVDCSLEYRRRYIDRIAEPASAPAETGIAFHEIGESSTADDDALLSLMVRKAALLPEESAKDLRAIVEKYLSWGGFPPLPSDAQDVAHELKIALTADGQPCAWDSPDAAFRARLDRIYRENGGSQLVIDDWKTSRKIDKPGEQMRRYAYAAACVFPDVEEIVCRLHFVRFRGGIRVATYQAADVRENVPLELAAIAEEIERRTRENDWKPRVGEHCLSRCSYRHLCPAFAGEVKPLPVIETEEQAREAAGQELVLRGQLATLQKSLQAYARRNGPIDLGDELLGYQRAEKVSVEDARTAAKVLMAKGVDADRIWSAMSLRKTELNKLVTAAIADAKRGEKASAREAVERELAEYGALQTTVSSTWKRVKKTVEEEAEEDDGDDE